MVAILSWLQCFDGVCCNFIYDHRGNYIQSVPSYAVGFICIPGNIGFVSLLLCSLVMRTNNLSTLWPSGRIHLFAHYSTWLSSLCRRIWRNWTSKMLVRYILSSLCLRSREFFQLFFMQYMGTLVFSFCISLMMVVIICVLYLVIIIKSEVWPICHCLQFGHETMVCAVCLCIFLWICDMTGLLWGAFVSWWFLPQIWFLVTDRQYCYIARYPTDDWHLANMFSYIYFSVVVCLEVWIIIPLAHGQDLVSALTHPSHWHLPSQENKPSLEGWEISGSPCCVRRVSLDWFQVLLLLSFRGIMAWLEFIYSHRVQSMTSAIGRIRNGLKVLFCFMHATPSYYYHQADLLTFIEQHMLKDSRGMHKCSLGIFFGACV